MNDLVWRVIEYKDGKVKVFTEKYDVKRLLCDEASEEIGDILHCKERVKEWKCKWKVDLIEQFYPSGETCMKIPFSYRF